MNNLFALLAILCLCSSAIGYRLENVVQNDDQDDKLNVSIKLINICKSDTFIYKSILINSFYPAKINVTLEPVKVYAFEEELDFADFFEDQTTADKVNAIKEEYNDIIVRIYSDDYINTGKFDAAGYYNSRFNELKNEMIKFNKSITGQNLQEKFNTLVKTFDQGLNLTSQFAMFAQNLIHPSIVKVDQFKLVLENLNIDEKTQILAFRNDRIGRIFLRPIVSVNKFYSNNSQNYFDFDSNGTIEFNLNLPFSNKNSSQTPCVSRFHIFLI